MGNEARRLVAQRRAGTMDPKTNGTQGGGNDGVQGEGNYDATHRYNKGVEQSVEKGNSEELAEKAKKALEGPEGDELRDAEEQGKQGANKPVSK
jgi:hypothetical protein